MLKVVDLNHWKGDANLNAIPYDAAIMKATGGNGYVDDACDRFVQQAIAAGKPWGVYHYFNDGFIEDDPEVEADWFVDNCQGYIGKGMLILDWERGGNPDVTRTDRALRWLQRVEARTGVKPVIYMSLNLVQTLDWSAVIANGNGLWVAAYVEDNTPIYNYGMDPNRDPNPHWDGQVNDCMWQFTSTGRLDGYGGNLDCSFFYGTRAAWDAYAGVHTATPAPAPEPTPAPQPEPTPEPTPDPVPTPDPGTVVTPTPEGGNDEPSTPDTPDNGNTEPGSGSDTPTPPTPVPTPVPTKDATQAVWDAVKQVVRIAIFLLPLIVDLLTGLHLTAAAATVSTVLVGLDKFIHENPNINIKGLLPF